MAVRLMNPVVLRGDGVIQGNYHALSVVHVVEDQTVEIHTRQIKKDRASEDDNDDCAEADGDIDLIME